MALDSLLSPCAPLLPVPPGGLARHCVPRPSAAWHSCPILGTGTHCTHVRAGCCCCCEPRPARPRRCCFHPPLLPAAHAVGTCAAHCCAPTQTTGWAAGWVEISYARRFRPWASALMVGLVDRRLLSFGSLRAVLVGAVESGMLLLMALMALSADCSWMQNLSSCACAPRQASPPEETGHPPT